MTQKYFIAESIGNHESETGENFLFGSQQHCDQLNQNCKFLKKGTLTVPKDCTSHPNDCCFDENGESNGRCTFSAEPLDKNDPVFGYLDNNVVYKTRKNTIQFDKRIAQVCKIGEEGASIIQSDDDEISKTRMKNFLLTHSVKSLPVECGTLEVDMEVNENTYNGQYNMNSLIFTPATEEETKVQLDKVSTLVDVCRVQMNDESSVYLEGKESITKQNLDYIIDNTETGQHAVKLECGTVRRLIDDDGQSQYMNGEFVQGDLIKIDNKDYTHPTSRGLSYDGKSVLFSDSVPYEVYQLSDQNALLQSFEQTQSCPNVHKKTTVYKVFTSNSDTLNGTCEIRIKPSEGKIGDKDSLVLSSSQKNETNCLWDENTELYHCEPSDFQNADKLSVIYGDISLKTECQDVTLQHRCSM